MTEPSTVGLTPPEEQLLALIREGRFDAEIAVRLGITNRDVKERIERLVSKLGVRDRAELREGPRPDAPVPAPEERPFAEGLVLSRPLRGPLYRALFALAFVAVAAFSVLAFLWPSDDAPEGERVVVEPGLTAVPPPTIATVRIAGRDMIELGPLFAASSGGVLLRAEAREDLLAVDVAGAKYIDTAGWQIIYASLAEFGLSRQIGDRTIFVTFQAVQPSRFNRGGGRGADVFAVTPGDSVQATFVAWAGTARGGGSDLHVELDAAGTLYVAPEVSDQGGVIVFATGEKLDVSQAQALGKVPVATAFSVVNECGTQPARCQAFVYADSPPGSPATFLVPVDGTLTCRDDGVLQLETASFRLFFQQVERTGKDLFGCYPPSSASDDPKVRGRAVQAGQILSQSTHYRITAETPGGAVPNSLPGGRPLSVVVANDRTIYVGEITPKYGCPCRTAN